MPAKRFSSLVSLTLVAFVALCTSMIFFQKYLIFPGWIKDNGKNKGADAPGDVPHGVRSLFLQTEDMHQIELWILEQSSDLPSEHLGLIFNGNDSTLKDSYEYMLFLKEMGISSVSIDYRGFGRSSGEPSEKNIYQDAEQLMSYVKENMNRNNSYILIGNSLGGGAATYLAEKYNARAIVLLGTFTSIPDVAWGLSPLHALLSPFIQHVFPIEKRLSKIKNSCVIIAHGEKDSVVPFVHAQRNIAAIHESNEVHTILKTNLGHNPFRAIKNELRDGIQACLKTT